MATYANFAIEDFAQDEFFRRWVKQPDSETDVFWSDFLAHYPEKESTVLAARALLNAVAAVQVIPSQEQGRRMWATIEHRVQSENPFVRAEEPNQHRIGFRWGWLAAAASIAFILGFGWWFIVNQKTADQVTAYSEYQPQSATAWIEKANETSRNMTVRLTDGSRVILQPQSKVSYPAKFSDLKREVQLTGEGFFEVVKNPQKPFMVYANGLVTQVVGTSFTVKALSKATQVTVIVRTGKVAVYSLNALKKAREKAGNIPDKLFLTPNQQVVFDKANEQLTKSLIKEPVLLKLPESNTHFVFENAPVSQIFETLEDSYGVTIKYNTELLKSCNLTAPLDNEPLFRKLDLICQTIGATYEVWGTDIIISGKGCQ